MVAKRSARHERTQAINQARALILTGPDELRARFAGHARRRPGRGGRGAAAPARRRRRLRASASRCASSAGAWSSSTPRSSGWTT